MADHLLSAKEAGLRLGMHEKTVRILCAGRRLRHVVTYGPKGQPRYKIPVSAIEEYERAHTVARTA